MVAEWRVESSGEGAICVMDSFRCEIFSTYFLDQIQGACEKISMATIKSEEESKFSRREGEVMEVLFRKGSATVREVWTALGETRTYSTVRKLLSILEEKGHVTHKSEGAAFVYSPKIEKKAAASTAMGKLVETFFQGSVAGAVSSLLGEKGHKLSPEELDCIGKLIEDAKGK